MAKKVCILCYGTGTVYDSGLEKLRGRHEAPCPAGCKVPKDKPRTKREQAKDTSEASIVDSMLEWLNALPYCYAHKTHGGLYGVKGKPDITGCCNGLRFEIEAKKPGGVVSKWQEREIARWAAAGCHVAVCYSLDELKTFWKGWGWN